MANTIGWGKATQNNNNGFGKYQNTIGAASVYAVSYGGETSIVGTSAAFSYSKSSYHQDEADPTPTITGTTGGSFNASAGLVFADTGTHNSTTGTIDLSASTIDSHIITYTVDGVQSGQTVGITASPFIANTYSMNFDSASSQYIDAGIISSFDDGDISFALWCNLTSNGTFQYILSSTNSSSVSGINIAVRSSGLVLFERAQDIANTQNNTGYAISGFTYGNWHHLCGTYNATSGELKAYVDGVLKSTTNDSTDARSASTALKIGGLSASSSFPANGKIDEVAIWNTALGETAIQEIYNATANNTGKALDLSTDYNNYTSSANLQYWNRLGD